MSKRKNEQKDQLCKQNMATESSAKEDKTASMVQLAPCASCAVGVSDMNKKWFIISFALFAIADIGMRTIYGTAINLQAHRLALLFNIPILLLLADTCANKGYSHSLLPNAAFIVFAVHYPIVVVLRKICATKFSTASDATHIMLYFVCIIIATVASMLIYLILAKYFPKLKNLLSGNR